MEVCPRCAETDDIERSTTPDAVTLLTCHNPRHAPFTWPEYVEPEGTQGREGLGEELGIYEDLPATLRADEPVVEYGILEYRYALAHPSEYGQLIDRYSHTALGPTKYSASAFLARALGQLSREGTVVFRAVKATGRWSYNGDISGWCLPGTPAESSDEILSWGDFAVSNGLDPESWPVVDATQRRS